MDKKTDPELKPDLRLATSPLHTSQIPPINANTSPWCYYRDVFLLVACEHFILGLITQYESLFSRYRFQAFCDREIKSSHILHPHWDFFKCFKLPLTSAFQIPLATPFNQTDASQQEIYCKQCQALKGPAHIQKKTMHFQCIFCVNMDCK